MVHNNATATLGRVRVSFWAPAEIHQHGDEFYVERFAPGALDGVAGQLCPLAIDGEEIGPVRVVAVAIDADGGGATWTVEAEPELATRIRGITASQN
jgi:hypothetical protein